MISLDLCNPWADFDMSGTRCCILSQHRVSPDETKIKFDVYQQHIKRS